jgi:hypothetical protein
VASDALTGRQVGSVVALAGDASNGGIEEQRGSGAAGARAEVTAALSL